MKHSLGIGHLINLKAIMGMGIGFKPKPFFQQYWHCPRTQGGTPDRIEISAHQTLPIKTVLLDHQSNRSSQAPVYHGAIGGIFIYSSVIYDTLQIDNFNKPRTKLDQIARLYTSFDLFVHGFCTV